MLHQVANSETLGRRESRFLANVVNTDHSTWDRDSVNSELLKDDIKIQEFSSVREISKCRK